jgi:hypothetical protein
LSLRAFLFLDPLNIADVTLTHISHVFWWSCACMSARCRFHGLCC